MRQVAESTDQNVEQFKRSLDAVAQAYGIPGGGVLVSYAINATELQAYEASVRIVVGDTSGVASAVDTTRRWARVAGDDKILTGWTFVPTNPGSWRVGVVLADLGRVAGFGIAVNHVPAIDTLRGALSLSDVILGREASGLTWSGQGRPIVLNPTGAWGQDEHAVLNAEVFGAVPGRMYDITIEVLQRREEVMRPSLSIQEQVRAETPTFVIQRRVSLENLVAGLYQVRIGVRDSETGVRVTRQQVLSVR
jgi:hypothetical protein